MLSSISKIVRIAVSVGLVLNCTAVLGFDVKVLDKKGNAVPNAVVAWVMPEGLQSDVLTKMVNERKQKVAIMDQVKRQFVPHVLPVDRGQEVSFPNSDQIHHHVYSFSKAKRFEIELYENEPVSPIAFDKVGRVVLGCNIHDSMVGYIYVSDSPVYAVTDDTGNVSFKEITKQIELSPDAIEIWHPLMGAETQAVKKSFDPKLKELVARLDIEPPAPRKSFKNKFGRFGDKYSDEYKDEYYED